MRTTSFFLLFSAMVLVSCSSGYEAPELPSMEADTSYKNPDQPYGDYVDLDSADLDGDGKFDEIMFDYSGGAHCCYSMSIKLSSDSIVRNFPYEMDGGYETGVPDNRYPDHFCVRDFDGDGKAEIFMEISTYNGELYEVNYPGIHTNYIVFDHGADGLKAYDVFPFHDPEVFLYVLNHRKPSPGFFEVFKEMVDEGGQYKEASSSWYIDNVKYSGRFSFATHVSHNRIFVKEEGKQCMLDSSGHLVCFIPNHWNIEALKDDVFSEGLCPLVMEAEAEDGIHLQRGYRYVDTMANVRSPFFYGAAPFSEGLAAVKPTKNSKWGFVNRDFRMVIPPRFDNAWGFNGDSAMVDLGDNTVYIDKKGQVKKQ